MLCCSSGRNNGQSPTKHCVSGKPSEDLPGSGLPPREASFGKEPVHLDEQAGKVASTARTSGS